MAIIFTMILGFTRGGWVTGGTAQDRAERSSQDAVVERLALICVAQFNQDSQSEQKLEELKAFSSTGQRARYISEQGWATMPDESISDDKVATECAKQLMLIGE